MKQRLRQGVCLCLIVHLVFPNLSVAKERLAVMSLKAQEAEKQPLADTLSVEIRRQIHELEIYEVVSQEDIEELAARTATVQKLGCENDNLCLIRFGNQLNSRFMVAGSLAKLEEKYHVGVKLLDTGGDDPGVKARTSRDCSCSEDELLKVARVLGVQLVHNYHKGKVNGEALPETSAEALQLAKLEQTLVTVQEENIIDEDRSFFWRYKWWIVGAVVILAAGALAAGGGGSSGDTTAQPAATQTGNVSMSW